jgi:hypothetical protein
MLLKEVDVPARAGEKDGGTAASRAGADDEGAGHPSDRTSPAAVAGDAIYRVS